MKSLKNIRGFTLIELLIVLAIASIVIGAVNSFFISNYKLFYRGNDQIILQDEVQKAMDEIIDKAMETEGVLSAKGKNNEDISNSSEEYEISSITFERSEGDLTIEYDDNSIYYKYNSQPRVKIAKHIDYLKIEPILENYKNCKGIRIVIEGSRGKAIVKVEDYVYFRNKEAVK
ncbi:PilW family protein [Tepidibacter thalassicus]|uniref:Prepilin-type N-terminal cleavage/methylation domain-containing protein n=1 Tax=Tepidibacter thalassicus DSM 15285 TaxID=1123350 RepID=A0A1M5T5Z8_9FIRM|nr:prepilin-type N-terminal cleavage/methylation domain-containing protein [Tepidibacter thalassicus]SHH46187.1 prepilin-type N-terminal cleavage/methylation domain-containing protein [Tepidibacter thalassicus DSM 15285]